MGEILLVANLALTLAAGKDRAGFRIPVASAPRRREERVQGKETAGCVPLGVNGSGVINLASNEQTNHNGTTQTTIVLQPGQGTTRITGSGPGNALSARIGFRIPRRTRGHPREALKTNASNPGSIGVASSRLSALARAITSSGSEMSAGVILSTTSPAV